MEESQKFFEPTPVASPFEGEETLVTAADGTLATPRFDAVEAQVARPVVPLSDNFVKRGGGGGVLRRRQLPIALVLISALAGGVVSLLVFRLYQQRQQTQVVATQQSGAETAASDATQTTEPTPLAQTAVTETQGEQQPSESPVVFEEFDPAKENVASSGGGEAKPARAGVDAPKPATASKEERKEDAKPAPRAAEPRPRIAETTPAPRQVEARGENVSRDERRNDDEYFEERRDQRRERRNQRREERRGRGRNIDRIKDIFEGPPPA